MKQRRFEMDNHALQTSLLSGLIILLTGSVSLLCVIVIIVRRARVPQPQAACRDWILLPGHALRNGRPSADFRARLERVVELAHCAPGARILVLGGTAPGQQRSEAVVGAEYLRERGVDGGRIECEDDSLHTLENFQQAQRLMEAHRPGAVVMVTNRYHLARSATMARNLGMDVELHPAEPHWSPGLRTYWRVLWEACLLHWYHTGYLYARATGNQSMLDRVSRRTGNREAGDKRSGVIR